MINQLVVGSYRVLYVGAPEAAGQQRSRVQLRLAEPAPFEISLFIDALAQVVEVPATAIRCEVETNSILKLELPEAAAESLYQRFGETRIVTTSTPRPRRAADLTGRAIRGYQLRQKIGYGGFGAVYRAYQPAVEREVAIKVILPDLAADPEFVQRFETEAQLVARLEHIHIVPLYDYWRDADGAFLVMRWLRGGSLRDRLKRGPLEPEFVARILTQIGDALAFAHAHSVIHRDLKPDNILLDEAENVFLTDFGIAKDLRRLSEPITKDGERVGTPQYFAPEQFSSDLLTPRTDLYSLGIVLFELLTGHLPFEGLSDAQVLYKQLQEPLPPLASFRPNLPPGLDDVLQKVTAKEPEQRYEHPVALAEAFRAAMTRTLSRQLPSAIATGRGLTPRARLYAKSELILEKPRQLIGRDNLLALIRGWLAENERVLLQGLGGFGKTALTATAAGQYLDGGGSAVLWCETGAAEGRDVFEALARALGEPDAMVGVAEEAQAAALRGLLAERKPLLVLDNVWRDRALYETLKAVPPTVPVLITSRHAMPLDGVILDVSELTPEDSLSLLSHYARTSYAGDAGAAALCQKLGYHPFALEIAAKRLKINRQMTPAGLMASIEDAPHSLKLPDDFAEAGREGVKELLDASVNELDAVSKRVLTLMGGLFAPVGSAALLALTADMTPTVLEPVLADLQARGLIERVASDIPQYRLHDLTYSYTRALFASAYPSRAGVIAAVRALVDDRAEDYDLLEFEQANILSASRAARQEGRDDALIDIMSGMVTGGYLDVRGHTLALLDRLDDAIQAARGNDIHRDTLHYMLGKRGNACRDRGDLEGAVRYYLEALTLAPNLTREVILLSVIGTMRAQQGQADAESYFQRAYDLAKRNGDDRALSVVLEHRGHQAAERNDLEAASGFFAEALDVAERLDNPERLFFALLNLGSIEYDLKKYPEALAHHRRAQRIAEEEDNQLWLANALHSLGEDYEATGQHQPAVTCLEEAVSLYERFGATAKAEAVRLFLQMHAKE
jgi:tetratricopeptide (TPR) repeat protein